MEANKYTEAQIAKAVAHRYMGGRVAHIDSSGVLVLINGSYTKLYANELHKAVKQSEVPPREDLHRIAQERNAREDEANGITVSESKQRSHKQDIAERYGI